MDVFLSSLARYGVEPPDPALNALYNSARKSAVGGGAAGCAGGGAAAGTPGRASSAHATGEDNKENQGRSHNYHHHHSTSNSKPQLTKQEKIAFNDAVRAAKAAEEQGNLQEAIRQYEEASRWYPDHPTVGKKIAALRVTVEEQAASHKMGDLGVDSELGRLLLPHQVQGVEWMCKLHRGEPGTGGILGDDMGLGKTVQVSAFIRVLWAARAMKHTMVVAPVSVLPTWLEELSKWAPDVPVVELHSGGKSAQLAAIRKVRKAGGVLLTTYGLITTKHEELGANPEAEEVDMASPSGWDWVILDEGHKIKNPSTQVCKAVNAIPAKHRLILSGTPLQNNLDELWTLIHFISAGKLLGTKQEFSLEYQAVIIASRDRFATQEERLAGVAATDELWRIIGQFVLRREKASVMRTADSSAGSAGEAKDSGSASLGTLTRKREVTVWVKPSDAQLRLYQEFLSSPEVQELLNSSMSPLSAITVLKRICCHVLLAKPGTWVPPRVSDMDRMMAGSGKLPILMRLVDLLEEEGHRTLIFSHSVRMLDIMQVLLSATGRKMTRIDGSMKSSQERRQVVKKFNTDKSISICLLSTGVGSLGLTLTGATRVILYEPSWNPAVDCQAVDRAYRMGQQQDVVTYRLITCGTVEEKMYRRQIFKGGLTKSVLSRVETARYNTKEDLRALFVVGDTETSELKKLLDEVHGHHVQSCTPEIDAHLESLDRRIGQESYAGYSIHDVLFADTAESAELRRALAAMDSSAAAPSSRGPRAVRAAVASPPRVWRGFNDDGDDDEAEGGNDEAEEVEAGQESADEGDGEPDDGEDCESDTPSDDSDEEADGGEGDAFTDADADADAAEEGACDMQAQPHVESLVFTVPGWRRLQSGPQEHSINLVCENVANACDHGKRARAVGLICRSCCCEMSWEDRASFNEHIRSAHRAYAAQDAISTLGELLKALRLSSDQVAVHEVCIAIGQMLSLEM